LPGFSLVWEEGLSVEELDVVLDVFDRAWEELLMIFARRMEAGLFARVEEVPFVRRLVGAVVDPGPWGTLA
jgi:hypothetical protein